MQSPKYTLLWGGLQVLLILVSIAEGGKIQLFKKKDFSDLYLEVIPTTNCYNVPRNLMTSDVNSIQTDTCFIAYSDADCKSPWTSKFEPGKWVTSKNTLGYEWLIDSIQTCNDAEGGPKLNVDLTTHFENRYPPIVPNVLESYKDVCNCQNLPQYVEDMSKWSIDNHGNELLAYFEPNCEEKKSKALAINAGHWINSRDMHTHTQYNRGATLRIQSFGPDPNSTYFKTSCKSSTWNGNQGGGQEKNDLDPQVIDEKFQNLNDKIDELESKFEHSKRKLDRCQNNVEKFQNKYYDDFKAVTDNIKSLQKDNEEINQNNLKLGNVLLNVTNVVHTLQTENQNIAGKVKELEEKAKQAKVEQDMSMEDKFRLQMEQFQSLLKQLNNNKRN